MGKFALKIIIAAAALAAVGCCPCRYSRKYNKPLTGTMWQLVQLSGRDVHFADGEFEITFGLNGLLTGVGVCNRFNAPYEAAGSGRRTDTGTLDIGEFVSTRVFCNGSETEQLLYRELDDATHFDIAGPKLLILKNGEIRAIFQAVE